MPYSRFFFDREALQIDIDVWDMGIDLLSTQKLPPRGL